ncbi:MAG TPA: hypothetical protein VL358_12920 [Caulobacteraceae bacterium]|jgi:hypothetical protein|nr:hypothetical protein [Caulobacteraceae bacterium]
MMKRVMIVGLAVSALAGASSAAPAAAPAYDPHDITGVWTQNSRFQPGPYPLTPEYAAILKKREDDEKAGRPYVPGGDYCLPGPLIRMMTLPVAPIEITEIKGDRLVVTKPNGSIYRIYLKRGHLGPDDLNPGIYGDAVAHWEGDTLVVDTIGLGGSQDIDGHTPHSDAMHVVQRIRRVAYDKLENRILIEDAKAFTRPVTGTVTYGLTPEIELGEFFCVNDRIRIRDDGSVGITPAK